VRLRLRQRARHWGSRWIGDDNRFHSALVPVKWFWAPPDQASEQASEVLSLFQVDLPVINALTNTRELPSG
jgi:hypothetical protein